jgi:hypothetical protein
MTDATTGRTVALSARRYRWLDRVTKLAGVALVALGLETGGGTLAGIAYATLGVALGLATVLVTEQ